MTAAIWMTLFAGCSVIVSIASFAYTWHSARQRATQQELTTLRAQLADVDQRRTKSTGELRDRITRVEAEVENLPNHSQMANLTSNIQEVRGDVGGVRDMLGMLGARIERIDNYLMNEGKRG